MWPIFNAGKTEANISVRQEETNQAYLAYQKAVLAALQDAEDALTRYAASQRSLIAGEQGAESGASSEKLALAQYRSGLVPYLNVLTAQSSLMQANDTLAQARQQYAQNLVALYKALGGGWQVDMPGAEAESHQP
jgi:outer membrane protein TolC